MFFKWVSQMACELYLTEVFKNKQDNTCCFPHPPPAQASDTLLAPADGRLFTCPFATYTDLSPGFPSFDQPPSPWVHLLLPTPAWAPHPVCPVSLIHNGGLAGHLVWSLLLLGETGSAAIPGP